MSLCVTLHIPVYSCIPVHSVLLYLCVFLCPCVPRVPCVCPGDGDGDQGPEAEGQGRASRGRPKGSKNKHSLKARMLAAAARRDEEEHRQQCELFVSFLHTRTRDGRGSVGQSCGAFVIWVGVVRGAKPSVDPPAGRGA